MGYRSTFITEDAYSEVPKWFYDKYKGSVNFGNHSTIHVNKLENPCFPLSSKWERKFYMGPEDELFLDIAKIIKEAKDYPKQIIAVLLHEDGYIDKVIIESNKVTLQRSLRYDPDDDYNPQLGSSEEYIIEDNKD